MNKRRRFKAKRKRRERKLLDRFAQVIAADPATMSIITAGTATKWTRIERIGP